MLLILAIEVKPSRARACIYLTSGATGFGRIASWHGVRISTSPNVTDVVGRTVAKIAALLGRIAGHVREIREAKNIEFDGDTVQVKTRTPPIRRV